MNVFFSRLMRGWPLACRRGWRVLCLLLTLIPSLGATPVRMTVYRQGQQKEHWVQVSDEGLEILVDGTGNAAIFYPWEGLGNMTFNAVIPAELSAAMAVTDPGEKAHRMQSLVAPLIPFARLPEASTNVHHVLEVYLDALLASDQNANAYAMSGQLPLGQLPPSMADKLYALTEALLAGGQEEAALDLLDRLRASRPPEEFAETSLKLAKQLAYERHFSAALGLYRALVSTVEEDQRAEIALHCAYLALELNDPAAYREYRALANAEATDDLVAVAAIIDGIRAAQADDSREALKRLGQGLALIPQDSPWREIAFYYNYQAYLKRGDAAIAQTVLNEMPLLFPDGAYTAVLVQEEN